MLKPFWLSSACFLILIGGAHAQTPAPQSDAAHQAVGLFSQACVRFLGVPTKVREFMKQRQVPDLSPEASAVFLKGRKGVGFDATNKVTRLALVSEDDGWCSVFAETVDITEVVPVFESTLEKLQLTPTGVVEKGPMTAHNYKLTAQGHTFTLVASINREPNSVSHAAFTIAP